MTKPTKAALILVVLADLGPPVFLGLFLSVAGLAFVQAGDAPGTVSTGRATQAPAYFEATASERLAVGALLERQGALQRDSEAVTADARRRLGLGLRAVLQFDPTRGLWVAPEGVSVVAPLASAAGVAVTRS